MEMSFGRPRVLGTQVETGQRVLSPMERAVGNGDEFIRIIGNFNPRPQAHPYDNYGLTELSNEAKKVITQATGNKNPSPEIVLTVAAQLSTLGYTNPPVDILENDVESKRRAILDKNHGRYHTMDEVVSMIAQTLSAVNTTSNHGTSEKATFPPDWTAQ